MTQLPELKPIRIKPELADKAVASGIRELSRCKVMSVVGRKAGGLVCPMRDELGNCLLPGELKCEHGSNIQPTRNPQDYLFLVHPNHPA